MPCAQDGNPVSRVSIALDGRGALRPTAPDSGSSRVCLIQAAGAGETSAAGARGALHQYRKGFRARIPSVLDFWSPRVVRMERRGDVAGIIDVLGNGGTRARRAAANTLIRHPDPRAAEVLAEALASDDPLLRRNVAIALGEIRDTGSGRQAATIDAALIRALGDTDTSVRTMAAASLGRTRPASALLPLISLLEDPVPSVRKIAVVVLRRYEDPRAAEALSL